MVLGKDLPDKSLLKKLGREPFNPKVLVKLTASHKNEICNQNKAKNDTRPTTKNQNKNHKTHNKEPEHL